MTPDEPEEPSELAVDTRTALNHLSDKLEEVSEADEEDMSKMGLPSMGFGSIMGMLGPSLSNKITNNPEGARAALALIHLETGHLLEKHADEDPEELV